MLALNNNRDKYNIEIVMHEAIALQLLIVISVSMAAAITDIITGLIYNWLTLPSIIIGLLLSTYLAGWLGFGTSITGILIGGGALFIPFIFGVIGGGDVKLMAAIGALMGPYFVGETLLASILVGGLISMGLIVARGKLQPAFLWYVDSLKSIWRAIIYQGVTLNLPKNPQAGTAPFGVSIFIGVLLAYYFNVLRYICLWC